MLGHNLPPFFPTFDKWDKAAGIATSIKSIDLAAKTYQNVGALRSVHKGYVNKVAKFTYGSVGKTEIVGSQLTQRILQVAIPEGATAEQIAIFKEMAEYAAEQGVELIWQVVP